MIKLELNDFSVRQASHQTTTEVESSFSENSEDIRLAGFDAGYRAGWDDADKMAKEDDTRLSQDLIQSLQDLSFTHTEAQSLVIKSLEPLMTDLVAKILPGIAQFSIIPLVIENLTQLASKQTGQPITLLASQENCNAILAALTDELAAFVTLQSSDVMGPSQVQMSGPHASLDLNPAKALSQIETILQDFFSSLKGPLNNDQSDTK